MKNLEPAVRAELRRKIPRRYHGLLHMALTVSLSLGATIGLFASVRNPSWSEAFLGAGLFLFSSFFEYMEHRFLLHRKLKYGETAFRIHTLEHHAFFTEDQFLPRDHRDYYFVLFPLSLVVGYLIVTVAPLVFLFGWLVSWNAGYIAGGVSALFFFLYELIHFSSHMGWQGFVAIHHRIHHDKGLMGVANFNVVVPIFDWLFGTLQTKGSKQS